MKFLSSALPKWIRYVRILSLPLPQRLATVGVVALTCTLLGACGTEGTKALSIESASSAREVVVRALTSSRTITQRESIVITQDAMGYSTKANGSGIVSGVHNDSEVTVQLESGGWTEFRQVGQWMFIKSYNSPQQRKVGSWTRLNVSVLGRLIEWPPTELGDPAFIFLSPNMFSLLLSDLKPVTATSRGVGQTQSGPSGYSLILKTFRFSKAPTADKPTLQAQVAPDGVLVSLMLNWPVLNMTTGGQSQRATTGVDHISIRVSFNALRKPVAMPLIPKQYASTG